MSGGATVTRLLKLDWLHWTYLGTGQCVGIQVPFQWSLQHECMLYVQFPWMVSRKGEASYDPLWRPMHRCQSLAFYRMHRARTKCNAIICIYVQWRRRKFNAFPGVARGDIMIMTSWCQYFKTSSGAQAKVDSNASATLYVEYTMGLINWVNNAVRTANNDN